MKTSELTGADLALWVARAIGYQDHQCDDGDIQIMLPDYTVTGFISPHAYMDPKWAPHEDWAQGGPLLDEFAVGCRPVSDAEWESEEYITGHTGRGPTQLISGMRAIVISVYGDEVPS